MKPRTVEGANDAAGGIGLSRAKSPQECDAIIAKTRAGKLRNGPRNCVSVTRETGKQVKTPVSPKAETQNETMATDTWPAQEA